MTLTGGDGSSISVISVCELAADGAGLNELIFNCGKLGLFLVSLISIETSGLLCILLLFKFHQDQTNPPSNPRLSL